MQDYQMLMGSGMATKLDEAIGEYVWFLNNPILDQPKQKLYYGNGFYKVLSPFNGLEIGDNILLDSVTHTRVVKIATPKEKQVFFNWSENFSARMKFTPEEWFSKLRLLTYEEIYDLMPHMSIRIKNMSGYFQYAQQFPEYMCTDCWKSLSLELRPHWTIGSWKKRCMKCGKQPCVTTIRNALKPINR